MAITDDMLIEEFPNSINGMDGVQRLYRLPNGYGLSLINNPGARAQPFAWEAAVVKDMNESGRWGELCYTTPLTDGIAVFETDSEANAFIAKAKEWALTE